MSTPPAPSARPPNSRRFEALDSPAAKAFVDGADLGAGGPPAASHGPAVVEAAPPASVGPSRLAPAAEVAAIPRGPRKERMQPVTLRISEAMHAQLLYIADNGKRSMNQFIVDVLGPAVVTEVEKIERRKALGLD
jgi:HicB family